MDCWNNVNAKDLKKTIFVDLKNEIDELKVVLPIEQELGRAQQNPLA